MLVKEDEKLTFDSMFSFIANTKLEEEKELTISDIEKKLEIFLIGR